MYEKTLLLIAISVTISGIFAVYLLPVLPKEQLAGELIWTNNTHGWVASYSRTWVTFTNATDAHTGTCIIVSGVQESQGRFTGVVLQTYRRNHRLCE